MELANDTLELIKEAQSGNENAKAKIVSNNMSLVWSIVHRFKGSHFEREDIFQIGCLGLVKAINKFDLSYNVQFSTYAVPIIIGEIKRYFRDDGILKVSRSLKELNIKINRVRVKLQNECNCEPTLADIAAVLEVTVEEVMSALDASYYPTSLSETIYEKDGSNINVEDCIEDKTNYSLVDFVTLEEEIKKLDPKEQLIIQMRYYANLNQEVIAKRLGVSQVQISRLEKKIIAKLRAQFALG